MKPELIRTEGGSVFRKIAMGSWRTAADPSVYGLLEIEMTPALQFMQELQKRSPAKITVSHLVGKAIAVCMKERPEINGMIRFNRIYQRKHVDLFYQINVPGDSNDPVGKAMLTGEVVRHAESLSVTQIAEVLERKSKHLRDGGEGELTRSIRMLSLLPWQVMYGALKISSFLNYDLGLDMRWAGMPRDPFGSVMITNVGALGIDLAWAPLVPYTKVPLLLTIGALQNRPWAVGDRVEVRPILRIGVTFDHRFMDGVHAAHMSKRFKQCFEEPEKHLAEAVSS